MVDDVTSETLFISMGPKMPKKGMDEIKNKDECRSALTSGMCRASWLQVSYKVCLLSDGPGPSGNSKSSFHFSGTKQMK